MELKPEDGATVLTPTHIGTVTPSPVGVAQGYFLLSTPHLFPLLLSLNMSANINMQTTRNFPCPAKHAQSISALTFLFKPLTFDLQHITRSSVGGWCLLPVCFIEIAYVVHEIWCSQGLTSMACCDLDL